MTNYTDLTDEQINRMVAEAGGWVLRDFCTNPADWGWLMERERIDLDVNWTGDGTEFGGWEAFSGESGFWLSDKPGRAVSGAFLMKRDHEQAQ